jgi:hypothetical protein
MAHINNHLDLFVRRALMNGREAVAVDPAASHPGSACRSAMEAAGQQERMLTDEVAACRLTIAGLRHDKTILAREAAELRRQNRRLRRLVGGISRSIDEALHNVGPDEDDSAPGSDGGFGSTDGPLAIGDTLAFVRPGPHPADDSPPVPAEAVCDSPADGDGCACRPILVPSARVPGVGPTLRVMDGAPSNFDVEGSREKS